MGLGMIARVYLPVDLLSISTDLMTLSMETVTQPTSIGYRQLSDSIYSAVGAQRVSDIDVTTSDL